MLPGMDPQARLAVAPCQTDKTIPAFNRGPPTAVADIGLAQHQAQKVSAILKPNVVQRLAPVPM